jgi:hypothetical protein
MQLKKEHGENVKLIEIPNAGHYELIDPESQEWAQVSQAVQKLVS